MTTQVKRKKHQPKEVSDPLTEKDWEVILRFRWSDINLAILDAFKNHPGKELGEGDIVSNVYPERINNVFCIANVPYRVRRANPHARLGQEKPRYKLTKVAQA